MKKHAESPSRTAKYKYVLVGSLSAMVAAVGLMFALYFLPVTLPIIGITLSVLSQNIGVLYSILVGVAFLMGSGLIGGIVGKSIQFIAGANMWSRNFSFNIVGAMKPLVGIVGSVKDAASSFLHRFANPQKKEREEFELREIRPSVVSRRQDIVMYADRPQSADDSVESEKYVTLEILGELADIPKSEGWPTKVKELRENRLMGHEREVLRELSTKGEILARKFILNLLSLYTEKGLLPFDDFYLRKFKTLFHPQFRHDQQGDNVQLYDEMAREFSDFLSKVNQILECDMRVRELFETAELIEVMAQANKHLREMCIKFEASLMKSEKEGKEEHQQLKVAFQQLEKKYRELTEVVENPEGEFNGGRFKNRLEMLVEQYMQKHYNENVSPISQFSSMLSLPRLSVFSSGGFARRPASRGSRQPVLLLTDSEEADKENKMVLSGRN